MAHIKINKKEFDKLIGKEINEETLREKASFLGAHWNHIEGQKWDVEVYPNRPDLLSVEGLARAYKGFLEIETGLEEYRSQNGEIKLETEASVKDVRPYIGGAVIRDLELSERIINGLIQLQEKLHETMGRKRDKLAIGLHDLSQVKPPFTYKAVEPEKVSFKPLEYDKEMDLGEILDEHEKGQEYAWILEEEDNYPVITDSEGRILSFPPVINNQLTEVEPSTTDLFIDVTGKDLQAVEKALKIISTALVERGGKLETLEIDGEELSITETKNRELDPDYFRKISGLELSNEEIIERLEKMKFGAREEKNLIEVEIPVYRTDIMHQYDLIEDIVIAHGYDNIDPELSDIDQIGNEKDIEELNGLVREIMQGCGAQETHTYILSNKEKLFENMELEEEEIAEMSNPLTRDYTSVRNWLMPSLMQVLKRNKHHSYPQKFFEAEDVSIKDQSSTGATNRRKLAYVHSGNDADYNEAKKILQALNRELGTEITVQESKKEFFKSDRSGEIRLKDNKIGYIGEYSEDVLENWGLEKPAAGFEIDLEKLFDIIY